MKNLNHIRISLIFRKKGTSSKGNGNVTRIFIMLPLRVTRPGYVTPLTLVISKLEQVGYAPKCQRTTTPASYEHCILLSNKFASFNKKK